MKKFDFIENGYKEGDLVWSTRHGWRPIFKIDSVNENRYNPYVIGVSGDWYTSDGKLDKNDRNPSIFPNDFNIPKKAFSKPKPNLMNGDPIIVILEGIRGNSPIFLKRYFSHWNGNELMFYPDGSDKWTCGDRVAMSASKWRLPTEKELNELRKK